MSTLDDFYKIAYAGMVRLNHIRRKFKKLNWLIYFLKSLSNIFETITEIQIIPKQRPRNQLFIRDINSLEISIDN